MRQIGHVSSMGELKYAYGIWLVSFKERDHSEDLGVDGRIT
jgi:hypothetical protein